MDSLPPHANRPFEPQPRAEAQVLALLDRFVAALPAAAAFAERLQRSTGTRLRDWVDTIVLPAQEGALETRLFQAHFVEERLPPEAAPLSRVFVHLRGGFPRVAMSESEATPMQVWLRCDDIADFCAVHADESALVVEGEALATLRKARFAAAEDAELWVVARRGRPGLALAKQGAASAAAVAEFHERFRRRRRRLGSDRAGFAYARALVEEAVLRVGRDVACALFFRAEREHWQRRCRAAQVQRARQDQLGLGWGNCDHHTYRCSRDNFTALVDILERLGFTTRERFYAGREAGWGAQVLEQREAGVVVFADVDLSPEEVLADFAHEPLAPREQLGTIGLWCALHGDSFLEGGLHHIAVLGDFDAARAQLADAGVASMAPFTAFPHLKQAFTAGELRPVSAARLEALRTSGRVDAEQLASFERDGAIAAHLEIIERNDGFRGFNQTGISEIISATDPRNAGA
ncbi:hypothetical protein [Haliangium ochraceum]|uniref:Uncharacterized protein n=1 Tax=Haliangium ochraceum (strain DSM 14365 / JCM 11303 / SMP-2) TaxID=502025 RepID=D0LL09_HALO1|nr:hypothetical protein [Haliangium ochraceum]ACY16729.1 conserved hypothetical protein [Haliangium ochraceum DSM 14365]